jgi:hypothetical protein
MQEDTIILVLSMLAMIAFSYAAIPLFQKRAMKDINIKRDVEEIALKMEKRVEDRISSVANGLIVSAEARFQKAVNEDIPTMIEDRILSKENMEGAAELLKASVSSSMSELNEGLGKVAESFKMAFIGNKGNESQKNKKEQLAAQKALAEKAIATHPHGDKIIAIAKQFDFDIGQMAAENPELAGMAIDAMQKWSSGEGPGTQPGGNIFG